MKTINSLHVGEKAIIKQIHLTGALRRRIMDMGLTKGTELSIRKIAPLGDPIELNIRGYELALRRADADHIEVV